MKKFIMILFILTIFSGCSLFRSELNFNISLDKHTLKEGITNNSIPLESNVKLLYSLSVPEMIEGEKVPFVIALHMGGKNKSHFSEDYLRYLVEPGLRNLNPIIFAPDVIGESWSDETNELIIIQFLNAAIKSWPIDEDKIVITGYSNGGIGTWYLIDKYPHKFSAAIPMASRPNGRLKGRVPTYIIHGKRDELFDWRILDKVYNKLNDDGANVHLELGTNLSHYQAEKYVNLLKKSASWLKNDLWD